MNAFGHSTHNMETFKYILFWWSAFGVLLAFIFSFDVLRFYNKIPSVEKRFLFVIIIGLLGGPILAGVTVAGILIYALIELFVIPIFRRIKKLFAPITNWFLS